jgi:hypothetical protein
MYSTNVHGLSMRFDFLCSTEISHCEAKQYLDRPDSNFGTEGSSHHALLEYTSSSLLNDIVSRTKIRLKFRATGQVEEEIYRIIEKTYDKTYIIR